jgi:hypothetical protein
VRQPCRSARAHRPRLSRRGAVPPAAPRSRASADCRC